ncbi:MAG: endolytic transglycosylase MltG [Rhodospirillaceae bacterium]|nr:endolytic transglycosylase MltG [Rhodospirillaceae bacterium]
MNRKIVLAIAALVLALGAATVGGAYFGFVRAVAEPGPLKNPVTVIIAPRSGLSAIAKQLADAGVVARPWMATLEARRSGQDRALKPGEYRFAPHVSLTDALTKIVKHDVVPRFVTIPEGRVTADVHAILTSAEGLTGEITSVVRDGDLLPETYRYEWGDMRESLIARMHSARIATLKELWDARQEGLPLKSPEEALVLASIVEKETGVAAERARVAGVFINRLKRGMKLQSDPTVVYGLAQTGEMDGPLTLADLAQPTPFNTYVIPGLPPSPICHPGRAALAAVLHPEATDALYFVADGTGGHAFAATLDEHNRNVARWRRIERQNRAR